MQITLIVVGKTDNPNLKTLIEDYKQRLSHYIKFKMEVIPDIKHRKNFNEIQQKQLEGELILKRIKPSDVVVLLDEKGKQFTSIGLSKQLQKRMNSGIKQLIYVIGGPYGFSEEVYNRSQSKISLSQMTFSHQMIRLFFMEQLYRGFTILKNEPYHHM